MILQSHLYSLICTGGMGNYSAMHILHSIFYLKVYRLMYCACNTLYPGLHAGMLSERNSVDREPNLRICSKVANYRSPCVSLSQSVSPVPCFLFFI